MMKPVVVLVCAGVTVLAAMKLVTVHSVGTSGVRAASAVGTAPAVRPDALAQAEPADLPLESWPQH